MESRTCGMTEAGKNMKGEVNMLRSMYSGISGIKNFQTKLDVIGNNIANVNTYGFKKGRVTFKDAMSQTISGALSAQGNRGGVNPKQVGLGSTLATIDTIHTEASMQSTGRSLDLAINGDGYFVFKEGERYFYSRAGNLYLDEFGTLVNADGYKVQAFNTDGELTDVTVNVNAVMPYVQTEELGLSGNLSIDAGDAFVYHQQFEVVDGTGKSHRVNMYFKHDLNNQSWEVYFTDPKDPSANLEYIISFNSGSAELLDSSMSPVTQMNLPIDDGNTTLPVTLDLSKLTYAEGPNDALAIPDGNTEGQLESFNIGSRGEINGIYSNGLVSVLGYLAIAKFSNSSGLQAAGGNLFVATVNSGDANIGIAGEGRGSIVTERLEMSNVDLSEEFTEMIVAQRGFQANTRIITTSDEILQELVNLKR